MLIHVIYVREKLSYWRRRADTAMTDVPLIVAAEKVFFCWLTSERASGP